MSALVAQAAPAPGAPALAARALAALLLLVAAHAAAQPTLHYLGHQVVRQTRFEATQIGGLSGIDYDPVSQTYYAISDNRSSRARYYTLRLDLAKFSRHARTDAAGVRFTGVYRLRDRDGRAFEDRALDAESIRVDQRHARLFWASEGSAADLVPPSVREMTLAGEPVRELELPTRYLPKPGHGVRGNLAFESLTFLPDGSRLIAATENALRQDGPAATPAHGSACRVPVWDAQSGRLVAEYVYLIDAAAKPPLLPAAVAMNGLSELLALDERRLIALERSYSVGAGFTVRLYLTGFDGATDVKALEALSGAAYTPMRKTLLLDLDALTANDLPVPVDNFEGITFGPTLPNGNRTLVLVSDDNFNSMQHSVFLAFELVDAP